MPDLQDAISLLEQGDARQASVLLEAMADEMPAYATARVLLARAYEGLGEWTSALGAWREALHIVPNSPVIRRGLERAARKSASRTPIDDLPSVSVSRPSPPEPTIEEPAADEPDVDAAAAKPEPAAPAEIDETAEAEAAVEGPPDDEREEPPVAEADVLPDAEADAPPEDRADAPPYADTDAPPEDETDAPPEDETEVPTEDETEALPEDFLPPEAAAGPTEVRDEPDLDIAEWGDEIADAGDDVPVPPVEAEEAEEPKSEPDKAKIPEPPREDQDLDRLIAELESARIVPRPDLDALPEPELEDDIEDVVSVTLARIYASQGQFDEAARVYDLLAGQQPENEAAFKAKADEMRSRASEG